MSRLGKPQFGLLLALALLVGGLGTVALLPRPAAAATQNPIPLLAYYYIWFDTNSWDRAKIDYPLLGRYASDDKAIMRQHVEWAKAAGINGFIVSWKSTDSLNRRLQSLVEVAHDENFRLGIIYEGLDVERKPLPADRIGSDLDAFISRYARDSAFALFGKPLVIWSGTWEFSAEDISRITMPRRDRLLLLASERNLEGYRRLKGSVDGNAYYWSSVNPDTYPSYAEKLAGMASAVHAEHGLWIAPAAPGFDARLIGGTTVVERKDGATLQRELNTAMGSDPDAIGLISWNEFSENTHIEPSVDNGRRYLDLLASLQQASPPAVLDFDSSEPAATLPNFDGGRFIALGGLVAVVAFSLVAVVLRASRHSNKESL